MNEYGWLAVTFLWLAAFIVLMVLAATWFWPLAIPVALLGMGGFFYGLLRIDWAFDGKDG